MLRPQQPLVLLLLLLVLAAAACLLLHPAQATPLDPARDRAKGYKLNPFIRYYEPARYESGDLEQQHRRLKRSTTSTYRPLRFNISSHGRVFRLQLWPDNQIFSKDVTFESTKSSVPFDPSIVYVGNLEDDEEASVHGLITSDGLFDGTITTAHDHYYVEPVTRYLPRDGAEETPPFHSIVYRASDVKHPKAASKFHCASQILHLRRTNEIRDERKHRVRRWLDDDIDNHEESSFWRRYNKSRHQLRPPLDLNNPYNTMPDQMDSELMFGVENPNGSRTFLTDQGLLFRHVNKRATIDPKKTTCMLYLQADHQFFQKYGTEEACIEVMTRHVQRVNAIYRTTDFNQDGKADNITFMIKRVKVHSPDALKDPSYRFPGNYGVEKFLELFSEEDYDAFCLAYMFTYRDFEMGTLGLAWTGDLKNAGGVCEKNGHYRGSMKSLNTGIVTLLNYGKHVPPAVSHVTLAHEIGHNFGSPHDPEQCTPGGEDGNFIMFARATSGDKRNNNHFSACSLKSINPVLNFKARSSKGCFTEPQAALCGNGVVEEDEECDCGWEEDCRDQCCYPQRRFPPLDEPPCRLTPRSVCSPSQGPCCTTDCNLKIGNKCRDDNGCRDASFCSGSGPQCPQSVNKPNKTICNEEFVCFMGECTGSICLAYGLESCQCIPGPKDPKTKACELCCKLPGDHQPCISSFEWNELPYDVPDMYSKPGTPCNDYNGYCDVFQKCREVDPSGPLATLRNLLLSDQSIASFKKWVMEHWYAVAFIMFGVISLLVLSTKLLGKTSDVKLKSITIMHSSTTETVRLPPDGEAGITVHPAVRSKLPLKRKVRDGKRKRRPKEAPATSPATNNNLSPAKQKALLLAAKKKRISPTSTAAAVAVATAAPAPVPAPAAVATAADEARKRPQEPPLDSPVKKAKKSSPKSPKSPKAKKPPKPAKLPKVTKAKKGKTKEVIDYSAAQEGKKELLSATEVSRRTVVTASDGADPVGKVQNWLLSSQQANNMPKSKSTPAGLADKSSRSPQRAQRATVRPRPPAKSKALSVGNISGDKVRLQVVYKPPFKFSLKLRKPEKDKEKPDTKAADKAKKVVRTGLLIKSVRDRERGDSRASRPNRTEVSAPAPGKSKAAVSRAAAAPAADRAEDIDSNVHTVQSDLEVLLSESEFLFSDD